MALNKKEQAEFAEMKKALAEAKALRFSEIVQKDVPPPNGHDALTTGWDFNLYSKRVIPCCSSQIGHGYGRTDKTDSQNSRALFSTKTLALKALRNAYEAKAAEDLAMIDAMIAAESPPISEGGVK